MFYESYLLSLKGNLATVSKAVKSGVALSRLEEFDYLFKKELLIVEGLKDKRRFLNKVVSSITNPDYRLARFYAESFSSIMRTIQDGYTVKGIAKQFKSFTRNANMNYICSVPLKVDVADLSGKITVTFYTKGNKEDYIIDSMQEYVRVAFCLVSTLGSIDELDNGYRKWFHSYLSNELVKVDKGYDAEPFIEKKTVAKDLKSFMLDNAKERSFATDGGKVIYLSK